MIVELVGPAGAGKTAVLREIGRRDPQVCAGLSIDRLRFSAVMARHAIGLIPTAAELLRRNPNSWWRGALHLLRLRTMPSVLADQTASAFGAIILDEGPVFSLSRLSVFQNANRAGGRLTRDWHAALEQCVRWLDGIVWLDAPDDVLLQRIRTRDKAPIIKGGTEADLACLLTRYREAYQDVLARVRAAGGVRIIEVDTARQPSHEVAKDILAALPSMRTRAEPARDP